MLNLSPTKFSKEPRPVYAPELDILGLDKYWNYDNQTDFPYMWAEANAYYYRGQLAARLKGGNLYDAPEIIIPKDENGTSIEPELNGNPLRAVDINKMVSKNLDILEIIEDSTVKKIIAIYKKYKDKLDIFRVAFSGGKDSIVLLDLVKKALPHGSFVVVFGDTDMEFPDTYDVIEKTRRECFTEGIAFYVAQSHLRPKDSWELLGPPSKNLRWCCNVHKSTPQTLKIREVTGKNDYIGLDFVGVRAHESINRSKYEYENYGKKQKGQYSHNSLLDWTSAEIWLYIFANKIIINEAYKKGNSRVGCLFCPMSGGTPDYLRRRNYQRKVDYFVNIVKETNSWDSSNKKDLETYVTNGGWVNRTSGRGIIDNYLKYKESRKGGRLLIEVIRPSSDWQEWIKTIGEISYENNKYTLLSCGKIFNFTVSISNNGFTVAIDEKQLLLNPKFGKLFRQVFRKTAYCIACKTCEANCRNESLTFSQATSRLCVKNCIHCFDCHDLIGGCLVYNSLYIPQGEKKMKVINCFDDHAPKVEWLVSFFENKERFFEENNLGPNQLTSFKRFLRDSLLINKNDILPFAETVSNIGWDSDIAQGLILVNLAHENPQIGWYINNFEVRKRYSKKLAEEMLLSLEMKSRAARSVVKAFKRFTETPLGTKLNFGHVTDDGDLVRTTCNVSDPRVILYALFKFAENCNDYKEFTLALLLNDAVDRDGISPTRIFGLDREVMTSMLLGLTAKYPEFINATFTHDMDKIILNEDKNSTDVLGLFEGG